jgi:endonuclease YncB( thermonuclease family)
LNSLFKQIDLTKKVLFSAFFVVGLIVFTTNRYASANSPSNKQCPTIEGFNSKDIQSDKVKWHVDGDTIHTATGRKLRLLNINAPEINPNNNKPAENYAKEALSNLKRLTPKNKNIYWTYDEIIKDRYGRELVYLFDHQGHFVNAEMIASGLAQQLVVPPNQKYWRCLQEIEHQARTKKIGIWSDLSNERRSIEQIQVADGFNRISGTISEKKMSRKYQWLILDNHLWVGIKRKNLHYFEQEKLIFPIGSTLALKGYLYQSHGKKRVNLNHPAMLLPPMISVKKH